MESNADRLITVLDEMIELLESDGDSHWSAWMSESRRRIKKWDAGGLDRLLEAYGGMGSFNDLILGQQMKEKGFEWKKGADEVNKRLSILRTEAWKLAKDLRATVK